MSTRMDDWGDLADRFLKACARHKILVATAESCTGGMIISLLTDIPGSSSIVDRGFVTYSNEAKTDMLGVSSDTLEKYGAVSAETAYEMAEGALENSRAGITLAVTGIAGPDGGSEEKPVGLVWFGMALTGRPVLTEKQQFLNLGRDFIRRETVKHALNMGLKAMED
jgi:nicotinamide-nucleotide amidase